MGVFAGSAKASQQYTPICSANIQVLELLADDPSLCHHLEIETYTWSVIPPALRSRNVVDQLVGEYSWCFEQLERLGLK